MGANTVKGVQSPSCYACISKNNPTCDQIQVGRHLGDLIVVKNQGDGEIMYKYTKQIGGGHIYTRK
jgi:hypothetical protein